MNSQAYQNRVQAASTSAEARKLGGRCDLRSDWEIVKVNTMLAVNRAKYDQHGYLARRLVTTGKAILVEDAPWDSFWGTGRDGQGLNMMGQVLMEIRKELMGSDSTVWPTSVQCSSCGCTYPDYNRACPECQAPNPGAEAGQDEPRTIGEILKDVRKGDDQ